MMEVMAGCCFHAGSKGIKRAKFVFGVDITPKLPFGFSSPIFFRFDGIFETSTSGS